MIRSGVVVKEEPLGVMVRFGRLAACAGCAACGRDKKETVIFVHGQAKVGDVVSVEMPDAQVLRASMMTYLVPLGGFLMGLMLGGLTSSWHDGPVVLGGLAGLALAVGLVMAVDRRLGRKPKWQARVIAVNDPDLLEEDASCAAK